MARTKRATFSGPDPQLRLESKRTRADAVKLFKDRLALQEHYFPESDSEFYRQAIAQGFGELLKQRERANLTIVREFYTCYAMDEEMGITFRGGEMFLTRRLLEDFYKLPNVAPALICTYQDWLRDRNRISWPDVFKVIGVENAGWSPRSGKNYFARKHMNDLARSWLNFMSYNIMATSHLSDISEEATACLYFLMTGQKLDIPMIIMDQIRNCLLNKRTRLVFPHLITDLCKGIIPSEPTDILLDPVKAKIYLSEQNRARKRAKRTVDDVEEEEEEVTSSAPGITLDTLSARLDTHIAEFESFRTTYADDVLRRERYIDPLIMQIAKALHIQMPEGFERAYWRDLPPASIFFTAGPGESSGAATAGAGEEDPAGEEATEDPAGDPAGDDA